MVYVRTNIYFDISECISEKNDDRNSLCYIIFSATNIFDVQCEHWIQGMWSGWYSRQVVARVYFNLNCHNP